MPANGKWNQEEAPVGPLRNASVRVCIRAVNFF